MKLITKKKLSILNHRRTKCCLTITSLSKVASIAQAINTFNLHHYLRNLMGDNATKSWEWHNNIVGQGYQARGVVRQPGRNDKKELHIVDMSKPVEEKLIHISTAKSSENVQTESPKEKDRKSSKKKRRRADNSDDDNDIVLQKSNFNPLLQALAKRLSNKTMEFC